MTEAAKEARRAYQREWAKKNRDKRREAQARYWAKKAGEEITEDAQEKGTDVKEKKQCSI